MAAQHAPHKIANLQATSGVALAMAASAAMGLTSQRTLVAVLTVRAVSN
jgi:hypothetical protein